MAIRVHILSKELGVTSKAILDKCRAEGLDVRNPMTILSAGLEATIRGWFSEGDHQTAEEMTKRVNLEKVRRAEAIERIEDAARTRATELNLFRMGLTELPPEIGKLTNVTELDLQQNRLTALSPEIVKLTNLTVLKLGENRLMALSPEIGKLTKLTLLDLQRNQITALPPEIGKLTNLTSLDLHRNQITALPPEIGNLTDLTSLYLHGNQLTALPPEIGKLTNLTSLYLGGNRLTTLPPEIGKLTNLTSLYLWNNPLKALPLEIGKLMNLTVLELHGSRLLSLPPEIGNLTKLTQLHLNENQLTDLPPEIRNLTGLEKLYLHDNPGLNIPPEILGHTWDKVIYEKAKPASPQTILDYFFRLQNEEIRPLNEAKVILVGQGSVGKTSLVKCLMNNPFDPMESQTHGIQIKHWSMKVDSHHIDLNIWDFGGQEIMHATHQFFLTHRSLYILVLDTRLDESNNRLDYWLKMIQTFGGDSPIILVGNKTDQKPLDIDSFGLKRKYPTIKAIVPVSCQNGTGVEELKSHIKAELLHLPHVETPIPASWKAVKVALENLKKNYISYGDFVEICNHCGVNNPQGQTSLIGFLHDLGTVLNFRDEFLRETNVLSPEWITSAVYTIVNSSDVFRSRGMLSVADLCGILPSERYPSDTHAMILAMMIKFELCYECDPGKYLIPELLAREEQETGDWGNFSCFRYFYDVLPSGIMSRFIARMHKNIKNKLMWRTGVVLRRGPAEALVKADMEERTISVYLRGPDSDRRNMLESIQKTLESLHYSFSGLTVVRKITIPGKQNVAVNFDHLQNLKDMGIQSFVPEGMREAVNVNELLEIIPGQSIIFKRRTLRIDSVCIRNICCFEELALDLSKNDWTVFLGNNGAGKTTVLRAIALGLCDQVEAITLVRPQCRQIIRDKNKPAEIEIHLRYSGEERDAGAIRTLLRQVDGDVLVENQEISGDVHRGDIFICGYGAARSTFGDKSYDEYLAPEALVTLFDYSRSLQNPETALNRIRGYGASLNEWLRKFDHVLMLKPGSIRLDEKKGIRIAGPWGELPLGQLADGFHFMGALLFDMLGWAAFFNKELYATEVSGIVLIDELEQHLHPRWQREIISRMHEQFPNIQFIVTSHSPICAAGIHDELGRNILLERQEEHVIATTNLPIVSAWRMDQILASELFGYLIDADPMVEGFLKRASILAGKGEDRSQAEEKEYQNIKEKLKSLWVSPQHTLAERESYEEYRKERQEKIRQLEEEDAVEGEK